MATIGQPLVEPEVGWVRYDDTNIYFNYFGEWAVNTNSGNFNGSSSIGYYGNSVSFSFIGSKIRIFTLGSPSRSDNVEISIDGVVEVFSSVTATSIFQMLTYEKTDLHFGKHRVEITNKDPNNSLLFDSIDIDDNGYLGKVDRILLLSDDDKAKNVEQKNIIYETNMTSNTTPSPLRASASSFHLSGEIWKAFNGTVGVSDMWNSDSTSGWIQLDFGEEKEINKLYITSRDYTAFNNTPKRFTLQGSQNGINFYDIKSFDELNWGQRERKEFNLNLVYSFKIYRINVHETNGGPTIQIGEIEFGLEYQKIAEISSLSEQDFINHGMTPQELSEIDFSSEFTEKHYIQNESTPLGSGKVFEQPLGVNKIIKSVRVT